MSTIRQELGARAEQRMALLPRMLQSIEVLQLATADLLTLIDAELERNEALELVRGAGDGAEPEPRRTAPAGEGDDPKLAFLHALPARGPDLLAHVTAELALLDLDEELRGVVRSLAERLDANGWLTEDDAELAAAVGGARLSEGLAVLRGLEPRGLGARGPVDAMLMQLDGDDPDRAPVEALLGHHLDALARNRLPDVAAALGLGVADVRRLLDRIEQLEPRPGARFQDGDAPVIRPDLVVRTVDGRHEVVADDVALPVLGVEVDYARMARDAALPRDVRSWVRGRVRSARELIAAVEARRRTLCLVGAAILAEQGGFLARGRRAIRPLKMADVAARVGLHTSTVSRAIAHKYLGSDHGVIALREFFDGGSAEAGRTRGRAAVRELLRELVAGEDATRPLTDEALVTALLARGVQVARRTVAKHRAELGIPSVALRRRFDG